MTKAPRPTDTKYDAEAEDPAPIGHNRPPAYDGEKLAELKNSGSDFADAAGEWMDLAKKEGITTEDQAEKLNDFITGARALWKKTDEQRKADKKPHDEAGKEVQAVYAVPLGVLKECGDRAKGLLAPYLVEKERKQREAERIAREKAEAERKAAEEAAAQAEARNDVAGAVEAEARKKEAEKAEKKASREQKTNVGSFTGGGKAAGLRKVRSVEVESFGMATATLFANPDTKAAMLAEMIRLGNQLVRKADYDGSELPGFNVTEGSKL